MRKLLFLLPLLALAVSGCTNAPVEHTVTFDYMHDGQADLVVKVEDGETVAEPETPEREGYYFSRWYKDDQRINPFKFDEPIKSDMTAYADWGKIPELQDWALVGTMNGWDLTNDDYKFERSEEDPLLYVVEDVDLYGVATTFQVVENNAWTGQKGFSQVDIANSTEGVVDGFGGFEPNLNIRILEDGNYDIQLRPLETSKSITIIRNGEPNVAKTYYNAVGSWSVTDEQTVPDTKTIELPAGGGSTLIVETETDGVFKTEADPGITFQADMTFTVQKGFDAESDEVYTYADIDDTTGLEEILEEGENGVISVLTKAVLAITVTPANDKALSIELIEKIYVDVTINLTTDISVVENADSLVVKGGFDGWTNHEMTATEGVYTYTYSVEQGTGMYQFGFAVLAADETQITWIQSKALNGNFEVFVDETAVTLDITSDLTTVVADTNNVGTLDTMAYVDIKINFNELVDGTYPAVHGAMNGWNKFRHAMSAVEADSLTYTTRYLVSMGEDNAAVDFQFGVLLIEDGKDRSDAQYRNSWMGDGTNNLSISVSTVDTLNVFEFDGTWTVPAEGDITGVATPVVA